MQISAKTWNEYVIRLSRLNQKAGQLMREYIDAHGTADTDDLVAYAYGLVTKYGEGSAELACQMYEALAEAQGVHVPAAEPAATASYGEVARMVSATKDQNPANLPNGVSRLVKRAGADATLKNAIRDGAEWAWVPHGDTCPFCITLASNGWQKASQKLLKGGHAEHIHAHCDCEFAVQFRSDTTVAGYDPDEYYRQYREAGGDINKMRRIDYAANRERINAQKRAAYAARKAYTNQAASAILDASNKIGVNPDVNFVCKLDKELYKVITEDIRTDEVIITDERIQHIQERHPDDYERFSAYLAEIVQNPDYIIRDLRPQTGMLLKEITVGETGEHFRVALRLAASQDPAHYKNSIITFLKIRQKEWERLIHNKEILYKAK
ncbi:MAG: PBECR2 nuclease fold domain-containing protein [Faecalibacterium sp.]|nr:PBECR2 nuclease fold domain-containing protein [Faecalibacterium sp.]